MSRVGLGFVLVATGLIAAGCSPLLRSEGGGSVSPLLSPVLEVTDGEAGHRVDGTSPENSTMVRLGDGLFFVYKTGVSVEGGHGAEGAVFLRRFDLGTGRFDPAVRVFSQPEDDPETAGYHFLPALVPSGSGALVPLHVWSGQIEESRGTDSMPPRYRIIRDLGDPGTWIPPLGQGRGLPSRLPNDHPMGARIQDPMAVRDERSRITHLVAEGARLGGRGGGTGCGLPRVYYRIDSEDRFDGPYVLVSADCGQPEGMPVPCQPGNIFTKGDLVLGRTSDRSRSLHLVWSVRNTFERADPECGCECETPAYHQWNYNLYHALSRDGGVTWEPLKGGEPRQVAAPGPGQPNRPLRWDDREFLVYEGAVSQTSERSFDVDRLDRPILVLKAHVSGTGRLWPGDGRGYPDNLDRERPPRYALVARRWDGARWIASVIDDERDFYNAWTRVRVDGAGRVWVFSDARPWARERDRRPRYTVSTDGGATWTAWRSLGPPGIAGVSLNSYADPVEPAYHYLSWRQGRRLYFLRLQLTEPLASGS